ncbi:MAG: hypothetical protein C4537_05395 [Acholeplasma sp.]|nr:MAG: hypothetical protein C4537_05395 [Acholeplasma sp.]
MSWVILQNRDEIDQEKTSRKDPMKITEKPLHKTYEKPWIISIFLPPIGGFIKPFNRLKDFSQ